MRYHHAPTRRQAADCACACVCATPCAVNKVFDDLREFMSNQITAEQQAAKIAAVAADAAAAAEIAGRALTGVAWLDARVGELERVHHAQEAPGVLLTISDASDDSQPSSPPPEPAGEDIISLRSSTPSSRRASLLRRKRAGENGRGRVTARSHGGGCKESGTESGLACWRLRGLSLRTLWSGFVPRPPSPEHSGSVVAPATSTVGVLRGVRC